ncbi:histidine kinase, partial [Amycolatopsis sp. K13G38]
LQSTMTRARNPQIRDRLGDMINEAQGIIGDIRTAIFDLHGGMAGTGQLRKRLHDIVAELTDTTDIRTTVRISGPVGVVPDDLAEHAEAVLREAMSNAVRHAHAKTITVTVSIDDDLIIDVTDDGIGIPDTVATSGLHNLTERAHETGGQLDLARRDTGGTRLTWSAPLP